jgi:hypothetical protein
MTQAELWLIEEGWSVLVDRLGIADATRFVMLLDRRTGAGLQHLQNLWQDPRTSYSFINMTRFDRSEDPIESHS